MRGYIPFLAPEGKLVAFATAVFEAYWGDDKDISRGRGAGSRHLHQSRRQLPSSSSPASRRRRSKKTLKANTDDVISRGGFGSPSIFLNSTDMYFGNDRLPLIREAPAAAPPRLKNCTPLSRDRCCDIFSSGFLMTGFGHHRCRRNRSTVRTIRRKRFEWPLALIALALGQKPDNDAGAALLPRIDSLDVISLVELALS